MTLSDLGSMFADMSKRVALPRAIRAIRQAKGVTQGAFATQAFISSPYLNNIEAGRRPVPEALIPTLANALGVEIDAISYVTESEAVA